MELITSSSGSLTTFLADFVFLFFFTADAGDEI